MQAWITVWLEADLLVLDQHADIVTGTDQSLLPSVRSTVDDSEWTTSLA